jgi:2-polyprenyl-3-methyl-5-hydroxy-6-metoxy-1,4-benzoquinol methylase
MDLSIRSTLDELMDGPDISAADYAQCLADLEQVNRITLTHRPTLHWLARAMQRIPSSTPVSIFDVAYGHGDLLRALHHWGTSNGRALTLAGVDLNPRSALAARAASLATNAAGMQIDYQTGDVFAATPRPRPDFIVSSQFTHHLDDVQAVEFVRWMELNCTRGWYVSDLQRHAISYYTFRWLARLAGWHRIVRYDGTVSIARSFRLAEWRALLQRTGVDAEVRWHMPFRLGIGRLK